MLGERSERRRVIVVAELVRDDPEPVPPSAVAAFSPARPCIAPHLMQIRERADRLVEVATEGRRLLNRIVHCRRSRSFHDGGAQRRAASQSGSRSWRIQISTAFLPPATTCPGSRPADHRAPASRGWRPFVPARAGAARGESGRRASLSLTAPGVRRRIGRARTGPRPRGPGLRWPGRSGGPGRATNGWRRRGAAGYEMTRGSVT